MKINKILLFGVAMLSTISINNESFASTINYVDTPKVITFGSSGEEIFRSGINTSDGGFVVVGSSDSTDAGFVFKGGTDDAIIIKYNSNGEQQWLKAFGGSKSDEFYSVIETSDGGFLAVGESWSTNAGFVNHGTRFDAIAVKYNSDGQQQWVKNFGGSSDEVFKSVIETSDGGFVCVGNTSSDDAEFTNKGSQDGMIVKYNSNGEQQWAKNFGGCEYDYFNSVTEISDGGFIVVGNSNSPDLGFSNIPDYYNSGAIIVKYNSNGTQEWVKCFSGDEGDENFNSVIPMSDGGFVVVGESSSRDLGFDNKGEQDAIIAKYNSDGEQQWFKNWGGDSYDWFFSVIQAPDGGFIVSGTSRSTNAGFNYKDYDDAIVVKLDSNGDEEWVKGFGGNHHDDFLSVILSDSDLKCIGYSQSTDAGFEHKGEEDCIIAIYTLVDECVASVELAETNPTYENISRARTLVNAMPEGEKKNKLQARLDAIALTTTLTPENTSANVDIYIKCENMLSMSLNTNSVTFENYTGTEDLTEENAVILTVNSSLPYKVNASLVSEIKSASNETMSSDKLHIKAHDKTEAEYKPFTTVNADVEVVELQTATGINNSHGIDLRIKSNDAYKADIYKTTIKFEATQN